jgi:hypothetical protein
MCSFVMNQCYGGQSMGANYGMGGHGAVITSMQPGQPMMMPMHSQPGGFTGQQQMAQAQPVMAHATIVTAQPVSVPAQASFVQATPYVPKAHVTPVQVRVRWC